MLNLHQALPKLDFLVAFEAAARHESFARAADELHRTPSAISHSVKRLEDSLGVALFVRRPRSIALTREGMEYLHSVTAALNHLASAGDTLRAPGHATMLRLATDMGIADCWLFPRLAGLRAAFPDTAIDVTASDIKAEIFDPACDAAIVFGAGDWPGHHAVPLFAEESFPVCAPDYLERHGPVTSIGDLAAADLLDIKYEKWEWTDWPKWLTGVGGGRAAVNRSLRSNSYRATIEAAKAGLGVALGWRRLVDDALLDGSLVIPYAHALRTQGGCYLVCRAGTETSDAVTRLRAWIAEHLAAQPLFPARFDAVHTQDAKVRFQATAPHGKSV